jgi:hypothetical protein
MCVQQKLQLSPSDGFPLLSSPPSSLLLLPKHHMLHTTHTQQYVFMDMTTYEETRVPRDEDWAK